MVKFSFFSGPHSLRYKAERLGWNGSLLLQTEAGLIVITVGNKSTIDQYVTNTLMYLSLL